MNFPRRGTVITLLAALGLAVTASIGLFVSGVPTIFSPFPVLTVLPALMLSAPLQIPPFCYRTCFSCSGTLS